MLYCNQKKSATQILAHGLKDISLYFESRPVFLNPCLDWRRSWTNLFFSIPLFCIGRELWKGFLTEPTIWFQISRNICIKSKFSSLLISQCWIVLDTNTSRNICFQMFNNTDLTVPHIMACHYVSYLQRSDAATALVATSARPALSSPKCPSSLESLKAFSRETISRLTSGLAWVGKVVVSCAGERIVKKSAATSFTLFMLLASLSCTIRVGTAGKSRKPCSLFQLVGKTPMIQLTAFEKVFD